MTDIPDHEVDLFLNTVTVAVDAARRGWIASGGDELDYGRERAEVLAAEGMRGGAELVRRYRDACDGYAREHGARQGLMRAQYSP